MNDETICIVSLILATESCSDQQKKQDTTATCQMTTEVAPQGNRLQRHSLIGLFTGEGHHGSKSIPTHDVMHTQLKGNFSLM